MNYECKVEKTSPIRRELTISVNPETIQEYLENQYQSLKKKAKIKGFRQGKVPLDIIKKYYQTDVQSDVYSQVIRESYVKALEENKLYAVGSPEIVPEGSFDFKDGQKFTYTAKIEVYPEIEVKGLEKIKVKRPSSEVKDEDIEKSLQNLRENHAEIVPDESAEGPVKNDDHILISFKGSVDGEQMDVLCADNRMVHMGAKQFMDEFEAALIGMKKGDTKEFDLTFPQDFSEEKLAGKTAHFTVTVHEFKKRVMPELDDEFAKRFKMETALELRKKVTESLKEDRERASQDEVKESVLKSLCEGHQFEIPAALVQSQLQYLVRENANYLKQQGFTEKMVRDYFEKNEPELKKRAEDQVRTALILDQIAKDQDIRVVDADLDHEYSKIATRINLKVEQVRELYEKDQEALRQLKFRIKEERAIEYVLSKVQIS